MTEKRTRTRKYAAILIAATLAAMLSGCASENDIPVSSISYKLPEKLAAGKFDGDYAEKMDKTTYSYSDRNIYISVRNDALFVSGTDSSGDGVKSLTVPGGCFTGTAGSGKSTTQACLIDRINHTRSAHIVTLEDPIEYLHRDDRSLISQREIAIDTADCLSALRACLRQAPDVILLGEMRDYETVKTALTAAETGHLVITTLHTPGAVSAIARVIDAFPPAQQSQVREQLAAVLKCVVCQQLLPGTGGGMVPAFEILRVNQAVRNMIRECKNYQIDHVIQTSSAEGMIGMDQYLHRLYRDGGITAETAAQYAGDPAALRRRIAAA